VILRRNYTIQNTDTVTATEHIRSNYWCEVTESEVTESEVTESEVTESEVTESEVTESEVTESEVTESEVTESVEGDKFKLMLRSRIYRSYTGWIL
jgi:hypothetical protein